MPGDVAICTFPGFWHTVVVELTFVHVVLASAVAGNAEPVKQMPNKNAPKIGICT